MRRLQSLCESASRNPTHRISLAAGIVAFLSAMSPSLTETAVANGETRTINLYHAHTHEQISATYLVNGQYDQSVLRQLNWFLRDWRRDEPTNMDPRLFDVVWEAYRHAGATEPIHVVSAYRSPETNAMLRRRSRAVAKYSQHMLGKAMDTTMPSMSMARVREVGMRMQRGGVGYYPTAGTPFVHLDVGSVRSWPRMTYDQLARLFPDGKTVHLPTNGHPLARYEEARAEIEARGGGAYVPTERRSRGFLAFLFGSGEDDEDSGEVLPAPSARKQWASLAPRNSRSAQGAADQEGAGAETSGRSSRSEMVARAESDLPRGETQMTAAPSNMDTMPGSDKASGTTAPLPPNRPSSLSGPLLDRQIAANGGRVALAALAPDEAAAIYTREQSAELDGKVGAAPLPPRRPAGFPAQAAGAPTPPTRPGDLPQMSASLSTAGKKETDVNAAAALARLIEASGGAGAPSAIATTEKRMQAEVASTEAVIPEPQQAADAEARSNPDAIALAYAAHSAGEEEIHSEAPTGLRAAAKSSGEQSEVKRSGLVPARLDRSNFRTLTNSAPASRATGASSVLGSAMSALRMAARAGPSVLRESPGQKYVSGFAAQRAPAPRTDQFTR
jgi:uncharacterized protein YcbK (DUF882 family)